MGRPSQPLPSWPCRNRLLVKRIEVLQAEAERFKMAARWVAQ